MFINHFSSSVCVSSCNQRGDYLIGLQYSDLKCEVCDHNIQMMIMLVLYQWCTYHPRKDYLHYGVILHITRKALCIIRFPSHYPLKKSRLPFLMWAIFPEKCKRERIWIFIYDPTLIILCDKISVQWSEDLHQGHSAYKSGVLSQFTHNSKPWNKVVFRNLIQCFSSGNNAPIGMGGF